MLTGNRSGEIEKGLAASRTAIARLREGQGVAVIPWDHPENRENPRVEKEAQEFYSHFPYNGPGQKPAWVPNGNSEMQDVARKYARIDLRAADFKG